ncbi:hypothetical protein EON65_17205 [archaeon]|nr:MAG: hypothetical protein EON65_17205 [archaeon]
MISDSVQWKRLESHVSAIKQTHLRNLMADADRCNALTAEHNNILLDYSRQNVTQETMVRDCNPSI